MTNGTIDSEKLRDMITQTTHARSRVFGPRMPQLLPLWNDGPMYSCAGDEFPISLNDVLGHIPIDELSQFRKHLTKEIKKLTGNMPISTSIGISNLDAQKVDGAADYFRFRLRDELGKFWVTVNYTTHLADSTRQKFLDNAGSIQTAIKTHNPGVTGYSLSGLNDFIGEHLITRYGKSFDDFIRIYDKEEIHRLCPGMLGSSLRPFYRGRAQTILGG